MTTTTWKQPLFFNLDEVESIAEEEATITLTYTPSIILPEEAILKTDTLLLAHEPEPVWSSSQPTASYVPQPWVLLSSASSNVPLLWLLGSLGLLLVSLLMVDTYHFIAAQYARSLFLGTLFSLLILSSLAAVFIMSWNAYQNLQTLRTISAFQAEGRQLRTTNGYGEAIHYINRLAHFYLHRPDIKTSLTRFYVILNDSHHDNDVCQLFSTQVMKDLDLQAYRLVAQRSKETTLLLMISHLALLDTVIMLWRSVSMVRDIATLYSGRPSFLGSLSLLTSILQNIVYADVSEVIAEATAEMLGGSVLSVMSTQAAQGIGSGILTARLGLQAMQACRPLPFTDDEKPRLKEIRRELVTSLKSMFETKNKTPVR